MKSILSARKFEALHTKKYADFVCDDIIDKLILKFSKTHSFSVNVFLSSYNSQVCEFSKGFIGIGDIFIKAEYIDENWICQSIICLIQKTNRDPKRRANGVEKTETKVKKLLKKEMEKYLINKTWDITNPIQDCTAMVDTILEKLKFKYEEYYYAINCLLKNDDFGFSAYSNSFYFFKQEDSTVWEILKNDDDRIKNSLFCAIYVSFFKYKNAEEIKEDPLIKIKDSRKEKSVSPEKLKV